MGVSLYTGDESSDKITASFTFFAQLAAEHQNIMESLNLTLDEAAIMAQQTSTLKHDKEPIRQKLFEVLRLIYEEQKHIGAQLFSVN